MLGSVNFLSNIVTRPPQVCRWDVQSFRAVTATRFFAP
jgi:hypothetical protein